VARATAPAAYPRVALRSRLLCLGGSAANFRLHRSASRADSPLLFGLAPRGVFRASPVARRAVGSYPTVSPLPAKALLKDDGQVSLPPVTEALFRGGLFSVALSVTQSRAELSFGFATASPGVTRRVAPLSADADRCPDFPPAALCPPCDGLRTSRRSSSSPARVHYNPSHRALFARCRGATRRWT
jgi:hypothetical protein